MSKKLIFAVLGLFIVTLALAGSPSGTQAQQDELLWQAWEIRDVTRMGDDHTGSSFSISDATLSPSGSPTIEVTPSGTSEETKLAFLTSGRELVDWATYGQVELEVYLPEGNALNPNRFFLGMADVTGEWAWVGGIFSETEAQPGWNRIVYLPDAAMRQPNAEGRYILYLSFFNADESEAKTPLTEAFNLGSVYLKEAPSVEAGGETPQAAPEGTVWQAWEAKDLAVLEPDNSGSTFAASSEVLSPAGNPTVQMTPSGTNEETKAAFPVSGADLQEWAAYGQVALEVYLPETNTLNPNRFFMGMADVTGEWAWVSGLLSETEAQPGWNQIVYVPDAAMLQAKADGKYYIYLSFFNADENENKTPLTEPVYLGSMILTGAAGEAAAEPVEATPVPAVVEPTLVWQAWEAKDVALIEPDNTGSSFALSEEVLTPAGSPSVQMTPSGTTEETKLAFPVSGADLQDWITYDQMELEIYLPETNALNPNRFFLGMSDVTGEWTWVGGVWTETEVQPDWNRLIFVLDPLMRAPKPDGKYYIYLATFFADEHENKTPLTEPFYLGSIVLSLGAPAAPADQIVWQPWEAKDISVLGDDNSGSTFALSEDVLTPSGAPTVQITPSGEAAETKLAFPLSPADLADWANYTKVELEVYLPPENTMNPNKFFMGMGDVTGEWSWVGGIFGGSAASLTTGWNRLIYEPLKPMREPKPDGKYMLYLSFFYEDASGKPPLTEPIYLGSAYMTGVIVPAGPVGEFTQESVYQAEVDLLLTLDDVGLLDAVAHETFDFFWYEANPDNGLIKDRSTAESPASIASVGFGLAAIPVAVDRGWISYNQGYERALTTLKTFAEGGAQGDHGFFYHFVNMETGERVWSSEISSIDTTLLIAGALTAGEYFKGTEVETVADQLYEQMDWQWMTGGYDMVSMGWKPDIGFLSSLWGHFDESLLLHVLAIGSPTHPTSVDTWDKWDRPVNLQGEFINLPAEPLFVYQYPLAYLDLRGQEDAYANYFNNTTRACERNRQFAADNADAYATYENGVWGISASDGPRGYRAYGATGGNHDGTVAPYASIACLPFTPEVSLDAMRALLTEYGTKVWGEYGFVSAINEVDEWYSTEYIGIDQGDILLMVSNTQDNFVWNLFMQNENVQKALADIGFVESQGDYAVTPAYLEAFRAGE